MSGPVHNPCDAHACRTCTPCAHGAHAACRGTVRCPDDHQLRACECCQRAA